MTNPLLGSTIAGKYAIKKLLGQGGMGAVYEGQHLEIGKRVAIKVIESSHAGSEEIASRFRREARAASAVESDNIVQVFDIGHDPQAGLYMVMEFLTGEDLSVRLARDKRLDTEVAVAIGTQAARALAKAHAAGVVHRDLKPANIFLMDREDGSTHIKVLDFGISKLMHEEKPITLTGDAPKALTRTGAVIGTPQYMSPEQAQGLPLDHRTDVWSLGAVLYEALAGTSAYPEMPTYEQTIIKIVLERPKPLAEIAPWVPAEVAAVVHAALTHDVDKRTADCGTFARQLSDALRGRTSRPQHVIRPPSDEPVRAVDTHSSTMQGPGVPTPPRTHAGVTLEPQESVPGLPPSRVGVVVAIAGFLGLLLIAVVAFAMKRHNAAGDVVTAAPQGIAASAATPTTVPPEAPSASVSVALPVVSAPAASVAQTITPPHRSPVGGPPQVPPQVQKAPPKPEASAAPAAKTQFGAAGVSTAY